MKEPSWWDAVVGNVPIPAAQEERPRPPLIRRTPVNAYGFWTPTQVAAWRRERHAEQRRGRRRGRYRNGMPTGQHRADLLPGLNVVRILVEARVGRNDAGGCKLRARALIALVAGANLRVVDALNIHPADLADLKMPRWCWRPIRALLRVRRRRQIDVIAPCAPVLCCMREGARGRHWDANEARRAVAAVQFRVCGSVVFTLPAMRASGREIRPADRVVMPRL